MQDSSDFKIPSRGGNVRKAFHFVFAPVLLWLAYGILVQAQADRKPVVIERAPLRFIKDPNPSFSAVAVDSDSNMLVVSDENMFRIMEYDRRENTPPQARLSEPKRSAVSISTRKRKRSTRSTGTRRTGCRSSPLMLAGMSRRTGR